MHICPAECPQKSQGATIKKHCQNGKQQAQPLARLLALFLNLYQKQYKRATAHTKWKAKFTKHNSG